MLTHLPGRSVSLHEHCIGPSPELPITGAAHSEDPHDMPSLTKPTLRTQPVARALAALLAISALTSPQATFAQETETETNNGTIQPDLESIEGKDTDTLGEVWLGIADCEADAEIVINLPVVPDKESLDIYTGSSCNTTTRDNTEGSESGSNCTFVDNVEITITRDLKVTLKTTDLVADCGDGKNDSPDLWFVAVDSSQVNEEVSTDYGFIKINIDKSAPDAPTAVSGGSGQNQIPVRWSIGDEEVDRFYVYVDSGSEGGGAEVGDGGSSQNEDAGADSGSPSSNADCGTGRLVAGASGEDLPSSLKLSRSLGMTATEVDLHPSDIDGDTAAVAVVAVDRAGNQSRLSRVVCVHVVPTDGFKDLYERDAGHPIEQGCPCSALGPAQAQAAWPIVLALLSVARRSRRSRS